MLKKKLEEIEVELQERYHVTFEDISRNYVIGLIRAGEDVAYILECCENEFGLNDYYQNPWS